MRRAERINLGDSAHALVIAFDGDEKGEGRQRPRRAAETRRDRHCQRDGQRSVNAFRFVPEKPLGAMVGDAGFEPATR